MAIWKDFIEGVEKSPTIFEGNLHSSVREVAKYFLFSNEGVMKYMELEGLKVFIKLIKNSTKPPLKSVQVPTPKVLIIKTILGKDFCRS